jgi:hypothetical protein
MQRRSWLGLMALAPLMGACKEGEAEDDGGKKSSGKKKKKGKSADGSIPAPEPGDVPAMTVGAWSKYKMSSGIATFALVDRRNDTEWLIDAKIEGKMKILIQAWVHVPDLRDRSGMKMKEARAKIGGGAIRTMTMGPTSPAAMMFERFMSASTAERLEGLPQEDVKVKAGHFRGCYRWSNKLTMMGIKVEETIWTHPAVPLPSMVRSKPKKGGDGGFELIGFGSKGAKKSF